MTEPMCLTDEELERVEGNVLGSPKESIMVQKTVEELRAEIVRQLPDLNLKQLISVALFLGISEKEIAEDLARAIAA